MLFYNNKEQTLKKIALFVMAAAVAVTLTGCDLLSKPAAQYDANGNQLVSLTINVGGTGRALTTRLAKAGIDYYEVVFKDPNQNITDTYYRTNWTKSQSGRISLPTGDYSGAANAVLFAGTAKNKTLLALGLLTLSDGDGGDTVISHNTKTLIFTLAALETDISSNGTDTTFKITSPPLSETPSGPLPTVLERDAGGNSYTVPVFMVPANNTVSAVFEWNTSDNDFDRYKDGMYIPSGDAGVGSLQAAGVVSEEYGPVLVSPIAIKPDLDLTDRLLNTPVFTLSFETPAENGLARIFISQPVYALFFEEGKSIQWHIRGGLNNDILDGGAALNSTGGSILLGVGAVNLINIGTVWGSLPYTYTYTTAAGQSARGAVQITVGGGGTGPAAGSVSVLAMPATGYMFEKWTSDEAGTTQVSTANPYTFTITTNTALYAVFEQYQHGSQASSTINDVSVPFRYVPEGSFQRDAAEENITIITTGYWMSETVVTQELFEAIMGVNPSLFDGSDTTEESYSKATPSGETQNQRPVERVSWYDAIAFCNKLSIADGKEPVYSVDGIIDWQTLDYGSIPTNTNTTWNAVTMDINQNGYRLPTEIEWMWAGLGADKTNQPNTTDWNKPFAWSNGSNVNDYAWHASNAGTKTHAVGMKQPNELGLYDMIGNLWEWCWDWFAGTKGLFPIVQNGTLTDYMGADPGYDRVSRGGCWGSTVYNALADRIGDPPYHRSHSVGIRLVHR